MQINKFSVKMAELIPSQSSVVSQFVLFAQKDMVKYLKAFLFSWLFEFEFGIRG